METSNKELQEAKERTMEHDVMKREPLTSLAGGGAGAQAQVMIDSTPSYTKQRIQRLGIIFDIDGTLVAEHRRDHFGARIN
jgi:hypothetical protein